MPTLNSTNQQRMPSQVRGSGRGRKVFAGEHKKRKVFTREHLHKKGSSMTRIAEMHQTEARS